MAADISTHEREHQAVADRRRPGRVRDAARRQHRLLATPDRPIDEERHQHRQQQDQADDRADLEILLANDLLVNVDREHVVVRADDLRHAELGHRHRENDHRRGDQTIARAGQRDRPELPPAGRAERIRRLVQARVGQRETGENDHHRVRERREHHRHHHARQPVHGRKAEPPERAFERALIAEQVDERECGEHRRREDRDQRDVPPQALQRNAGALNRVREPERERHGQQRGERREGQRVLRRPLERRRRQVLREVDEADEGTRLVLHTTHQQHRQRQRQEDEQRRGDEDDPATRGDRLAPPAGRRAR